MGPAHEGNSQVYRFHHIYQQIDSDGITARNYWVLIHSGSPKKGQ
jgi:hypothetical protein